MRLPLRSGLIAAVGICLLMPTAAPYCHASTVTGNVFRVSNVAHTNSVIDFTPFSTPIIDGGTLYTPFKATLECTNGTFSQELIVGAYAMAVDGKILLRIYVPNDTATYSFNTLTTNAVNFASTNAFAFIIRTNGTGVSNTLTAPILRQTGFTTNVPGRVWSAVGTNGGGAWSNALAGSGSGDVTTAQLNNASNVLSLRIDGVDQDISDLASDTTALVSATSNRFNASVTALTNLANTKQHGSAVLTNLSNTASNNIDYLNALTALTNSSAAKQTGSFILTNLIAMGITNVVTVNGVNEGIGTNAGVLWITNVIYQATNSALSDWQKYGTNVIGSTATNAARNTLIASNGNWVASTNGTVARLFGVTGRYTGIGTVSCVLYTHTLTFSQPQALVAGDIVGGTPAQLSIAVSNSPTSYETRDLNVTTDFTASTFEVYPTLLRVVEINSAPVGSIDADGGFSFMSGNSSYSGSLAFLHPSGSNNFKMRLVQFDSIFGAGQTGIGIENQKRVGASGVVFGINDEANEYSAYINQLGLLMLRYGETNNGILFAPNLGTNFASAVAIMARDSLGQWRDYKLPVTDGTGLTNFIYAVSQTNVNGEVSVTNATTIGSVYDQIGRTNRLRSFRAGANIVLTNEGTNIVIAGTASGTVPNGLMTNFVDAAFGNTNTILKTGFTFDTNGTMTVWSTNGAGIVTGWQHRWTNSVEEISYSYNGGAFTNVGKLTTNGMTLRNGSAAFPAIGWFADDDITGTGFYRSAANEISASVNGTATLTLDANGLGLLSGTLDIGSSATSGSGAMELNNGFYIAGSGGVFVWSASSGVNGTLDTRTYRHAAGVVGFGTTAATPAGNVAFSNNVAPYKVTTGTLTLVTNVNARGLLFLQLAFDDVTGGNPSCTVVSTNTISTNNFGAVSPNLSGLTLVGTISTTNHYNYPAQTNAVFVITDTSTGGAAVRVIQSMMFN